jgi:hypothetical protein
VARSAILWAAVGLLAAPALCGCGDWKARKQSEERARAAEQARQAAEAEPGRRREVAEGLRSLRAACEAKGPGARLRGKALVWDLTEGKLSPAHERLPAELQGKTTDPELTVFLSVERSKAFSRAYGDGIRGGASALIEEAIRKGTVAGRGALSPRPAPRPPAFSGYRVDQKVCVVYWPSKEPAGSALVKGLEPQDVILRPRGAGASDELGEFTTPLVGWIAGLPRGAN